MDTITFNRLQSIVSGSGLGENEINELVDLMDDYARQLHNEKLRKHGVTDSGLKESFLEWLTPKFDFVDGDWYWKEDTDGDKPLSHSEILNLYKAAYPG